MRLRGQFDAYGNQLGRPAKRERRVEAVAEPKVSPAPPVLASRRPGRPLASQAHLTITAQKPWVAEGMSRRTWYRRQREKD